MKTEIAQHLRKGIGSTGRKLLVVLFAAGLSLGASAQRGGHGVGGGHYGGGHYGGGVVYSRPYVGLGLGLGWGFGYPYGPYGLYSPFGYPYPPYYYGEGAMPSRLAYQVQDIKDDYAAQIKETRHDKSIPRKERRQKIDQLKHDRDAAVIQARKDYFYNSRRNYNGPQPYNGNGQQQQGQPQQQPNTQKPTSTSGNENEQPEYQPAGGTAQGK